MNYKLSESIISNENYNLHRPTREMVRLRTLELAAIAGREAHEIRQVDYEQSKRELTGESDFDRQEAVLNGKW